MKILIISPTHSEEPLGVMYLSSSLKHAGFSVEGVLFKKDDPVRVFDEFSPDMVMFSVMTGEHLECLEICRNLKARRPFVSVFGGFHVSFCPEIIHEGCVDIAGLGECEEAVVELAARIDNDQEIKDVRNFWIKRDGFIHKNGLRPLCSDLDSLVFPDRDLFAGNRETREFCVMTSRGCPYNCTYCSNLPFRELYSEKTPVRFRSPDNIVQELLSIKNSYEVDVFNFHDDIFTLRKTRLRELAGKYIKDVDTPFYCSVRADNVDEECVKLLEKMGCKKVFMGVEAGNDRVRKDLLRRTISKEQMTGAVKLFKKYGIQVFCQNILGLPNTTIEDDFETLKLNITMKPDFAWVSIYTPYPKTVLGELCIHNGLIDSFDDVYSAYHYKSPLKISHRDKVHKLHKLFSLTVDHPEILDKVVSFVMDDRHYDFDFLHKTFRSYRDHKYNEVVSKPLGLPGDVRTFMNTLNDL